MRALSKTKGQLMQEAREYLEANTELTNFSPGSIVRSILEVFTAQLAEQYEIMNTNLLQTYASTAVGTALDNIGIVFGITRNSPKRSKDKSHSNFRFYIDTSTGFTAAQLAAIQYDANQAAGITSDYVTETSFTIPNGTIIKRGKIEYATTEAAVFTGSDIESFVPILAAGFGGSYNVPAFTLNDYLLESREFSYIRQYLKCENKQSITNGSFIEDDPSFRARILNAHLGAAKANQTAVRLAALSVPGVSDVILKEYAAGIGTFSVYVLADSPIPSDGILESVRQAINFDKAFGVKAIISRPLYKGFQGKFRIDFQPTATASERAILQRQARIAIELYINNIGIGGEFVANELIERVMALSTKIRDISVIMFGAGEYDVETGTNKKYRSLFFMNQRIPSDHQPLAVPGKIVIC